MSLSKKKNASLRIENHPVLGPSLNSDKTWIIVDGEKIWVNRGEPIAAALLAMGIRTLHYMPKYGDPRGGFCAIGRCTDCIMTVNGKPNVRTCVTLDANLLAIMGRSKLANRLQMYPF